MAKMILATLASLIGTSTAFAGTIKVQDGSKIRYERKYESDSGYADINECVRHVWTSAGVYVGAETVHDLNDEKNVLCKGLKPNEKSAPYYYAQDFDSGHTDKWCFTVVGNARKTVDLAFCGK